MSENPNFVQPNTTEEQRRILKQLIEALAKPNTTVNELSLDVCVTIFRGDCYWWSTVRAGVDRRFVSVEITTGEDGKICVSAKKSKMMQPGFLEIDIAAVQALGWRQPVITLEEILANPGLVASMLFAVDGNKDTFVCFAKGWWLTLTPEQLLIEMLASQERKAARIHIAWLQANCPNKQLTDVSSFDAVTRACGDHHPFPKQSDLDVVGDDKPAYVSAYLLLWNPEPPEVLRGSMFTDFTKFDVFVNFLRNHPV